ncbi:MAG: thiol peroxidase [bacterium]
MGRTVTLRGAPFEVEGEELSVGQSAPNFKLIEKTIEGIEIITLDDFKGRVLILNVVPSLDTSVCSTQTKRMSQIVDENKGKFDVLTVSVDLQFAQARWAVEQEIFNIRFGSDHLDANFGHAYRTLIPSLRLEQRSMFVVDKNGILQYKQYVNELGDEPDYGPPIAKALELASQ